MVIVISAAVDYVLISLDTQDWIWFSNRFAETPNRVIVQCYGKSINLDRGSNHFSALAEILNEIISGQKRYDPLSMSLETYQDYQHSSGMMTIEFFYSAALRLNNEIQAYSGVDHLVIPLEGRHARTDAIFGQNQGIPIAGSLHVESTERLREYLRNENICLTATSTQ